MDGRAAVGAGVFAAGAGALGYLGADPMALTAAGSAALVSVGAGVSNRRGRQRDELRDHLTEQICPVLGLPKPSRKAVQLTGWSEGFVGTPTRVVLVYAAHLIPDAVWIGKVKAVTENCLAGTYRVAKTNERKHRMVLERYEPETEAPLEKAAVRTQEVVQDLFGETAHAQVELNEDGEPRQIKIKHTQGNNMAIANRRKRTERILATRIPGDWRARWDLQNDTVEFFIRTPMPTLVYPPTEHSQTSVADDAYQDFEIPLGEDEDGRTLTWFPRKQIHMLVIGKTGSGKTVVQHNVLQRLTQAGWRTWILDGKRIEFIGFRSWPNVELIASRLEHQVKMVVDAHALMMERYDLVESGKASLTDFEPLALVVDEATTFLKGVDRWWKQVKPKGAPAKAPVLDLMADIARLGRSAKIHMLVGLQRPDVEFIGGEMRDNFGARVAMGRLSPQGAMMMWDTAAVGTAVPQHIKGRATALNADGEPVMLQTYLAPNPDENRHGYDHEATEAVRPRELLYPRKLMEVLEPEATDIDGNEVPLMYDDYMAARVYEAEEQPRVAGAATLPAPSSSALGALQSLTGSRASSTRSTGRTSGTASTSSTSSTADASRGEVDQASSAEDSRMSVDSAEPGELPGSLDGYEEVESLGVLELTSGDLVLIDPELEQWGVVQQEPESDDDGEVMIDFLDWSTGEPEATSLPETEIVSARRVLNE